MKKTLIGLLLISTVALGGIKPKQDNDFSGFDNIPAKELSAKLAKELTENMHLPAKIDYLTQMQSILSYGTSLIFSKEVNIEHKDIKEIWLKQRDRLIQAMFKIDAQNICQTPIWRYMIYKRNIIPEFVYKDMNGKILFEYTVEADDCNAIQ